MIATQRNELGLTMAQRAYWSASTESLERLRHLLLSNSIVKRRDWNVSTVNNLRPVLIGIDVGARVERAQRGLASRSLSDGPGSKASALQTCKQMNFHVYS